MTSRIEAQLIGGGVASAIYARNITVGGTPVYINMLPRTDTGDQKRAEVFMIRPITKDVHLAVNAVPTTGGQNSARLVAGSEYVLPFAPSVNTLGFLSAEGNSTNVQVYVRPVVVR